MWSHAQARGQPQVLALLSWETASLLFSCCRCQACELPGILLSLPLVSTQKDWDYRRVCYGPAVTRSWDANSTHTASAFATTEPPPQPLTTTLVTSLLRSQCLCVNVGVCTPRQRSEDNLSGQVSPTAMGVHVVRRTRHCFYLISLALQ